LIPVLRQTEAMLDFERQSRTRFSENAWCNDMELAFTE